VRPSRLLNRASAGRALRELLDSLGTGDDIKDFRDSVISLRATRKRVPFGPLSLFHSDTHKWCLPRPTVGIAEFVRIYEEYVNRPLGSVPNPGELAAKIYRGSPSSRKLIRGKDADDWLSPLLTLMAASLHLGAEVEEAAGTLVQVRLGDALMGVTSEGCWSNRYGMVKPFDFPAFDAAMPATTIGAITATNPVLEAVFSLAVETQKWRTGLVGTILAHALVEGAIDAEWLRSMVFNGAKAVPAKFDLEAAERSMVECLGILDSANGDALPDIHDSAVPNLMSARQFRAVFGDVKQDRPGRKIKRATIHRWRQALNDHYKELMSAQA
jgi:hypothetical protein